MDVVMDTGMDKKHEHEHEHEHILNKKFGYRISDCANSGIRDL